MKEGGVPSKGSKGLEAKMTKELHALFIYRKLCPRTRHPIALLEGGIIYYCCYLVLPDGPTPCTGITMVGTRFRDHRSAFVSLKLP